MAREILDAFRNAVENLVSDYQNDPKRFWNERDIHWRLFYRLKQESVFKDGHHSELIRAEFPTINKYGKRRKARGHFDLAILDPVSADSEDVRNLSPWAEWGDYLPKVEVLIGVEIKMWVSRWSRNEYRDRIEWDIEKLTDGKNGVRHKYFLNFIQLDFSRPNMVAFYGDLRTFIAEKAKSWPDLQVLYLPNERKVQPNAAINWIQCIK